MSTMPSLTAIPAFTWLLLVPFLLLLQWKVGGRLVRQYLLRRYTTVDRLPLLGLQRDKKIQGTAVICGGRYTQWDVINIPF